MRSIAEKNIRDTVQIALDHQTDHAAMIVYDQQSPLARLLAESYQTLLPEASVFDFDQTDPEIILKAFDLLSPGDLVVLIQSTSFRLNRFRIRLELFNRHLKVIEHPHLYRIQNHEIETYINAIAYDPSYYRRLGPEIKGLIDQASEIDLVSEGGTLHYRSAFCPAKLNIGHYEGMKNTGGQFPIGEVFTEPEDLEAVNGQVDLFAFGGVDFSLHVPKEPVTIVVEKGKIVDAPKAPDDFLLVLDEIRKTEDVVWIRELGFGLNRAMTKQNTVKDIGTFERMCGIHLSLGFKHLQYKKPQFPKKGGLHVDVFVDVQSVEIEGLTVFESGSYAPLLAKL